MSAHVILFVVPLSNRRAIRNHDTCNVMHAISLLLHMLKHAVPFFNVPTCLSTQSNVSLFPLLYLTLHHYNYLLPYTSMPVMPFLFSSFLLSFLTERLRSERALNYTIASAV